MNFWDCTSAVDPELCLCIWCESYHTQERVMSHMWRRNVSGANFTEGLPWCIMYSLTRYIYIYVYIIRQTCTHLYFHPLYYMYKYTFPHIHIHIWIDTNIHIYILPCILLFVGAKVDEGTTSMAEFRCCFDVTRQVIYICIFIYMRVGISQQHQ